jgi:hypothetical protein
MAAILSLIAALAAALIARSVMISNHRQAWINGLRDDLATFFAAADIMRLPIASSTAESSMKHDEHRQARENGTAAYRKILMRLNIHEPLHRQLDASLA